MAIVLFSDLVDSTALLASLGDDRMDSVRRAHVQDVTDAVARSGGRVVKTLGDGVMASFESALGALRSAAAIQAAVERLDIEQGGIGLAARVGVAAGEPIVDGDDLHGMPVVIASRLSSVAETGEVLVQDLVEALVASRDGVELEPAKEYMLKGIPSPVSASRLRWRELAPTRISEEGRGGELPPEGPAADDPDSRASQPPGADDIRLPPALAAYVDEPLIGRDGEIERLREATTPRDRSRAVLILGEPGIGKTRHAAAAAAEAHTAGAVVVLARCPPEATIAFEPWVRAIGELALAGEDAWRVELAQAAGPELAGLVPELSQHATLADRGAVDEVIAAEGARYRLFRGIGAVLALAADEAPLHLVLDDAHWCDPASAQALSHLLASPPVRLVLVVTARDRDLSRRHPVSKALSDLRRTGDLEELRLVGLDTSGLASLVGLKVGRSITPQLADQLQARTSGNPFFAGELVRDLDGRGALRAGEVLDMAPAPEAVTDLVEERLARLSPNTEQLLVAVAAIGPAAPVELAARAAGLDSEEAVEAVGEALSEQLVDEVVAAESTIGFPHALIREALISGVGDAARARLHLALARELERSPDAEPAELARHYGFAVDLVGPEPALAAHRTAARSAAEEHDHEAAAAHLRQMLSLMPEVEPASGAPILLELGEQDLLSADLVRARDSFRSAVEAARAIGDSATLARAALGFAGGDVGFGWESGGDDEAVALLTEALEALSDEEPRLALRITFRLAYLLMYTDEAETVESLARRAKELAARVGDAEARILGPFTALVATFARHPNPLDFGWIGEDMESLLGLLEAAEECGREDLLFRVVQHSTWVHYGLGRIADCERAVERAAAIAERLGSPRFTWEVELSRAMRLFDRGSSEEAEALSRSAGAVARHMRPDLQILGELAFVTWNCWFFRGETEMPRRAFEALDAGMQRGLIAAAVVGMQALDGQLETARRGLRMAIEDDFDRVRRPDGHLPAAVCFLAEAAIAVGDLEAGARLRSLLEPMRGLLIPVTPAVSMGQVTEAYIGRLDLLAGNVEEAIEELREAVVRADDLDLVWAQAWIRVDLARALHRGGDENEALEVLGAAEAIAARAEVGWASRQAAEARAEFEGSVPSSRQRSRARSKPIRALAARGGRRALAAMVRDLDDAELERRFASPRRQRALLRRMARGFQPAQAAGFEGAIAFELETFVIEAPPDTPWRWAIEVDAKIGRARLIEPAPLDPAVTMHFGLADWVRVMAGVEDPLSAMVDGRCVVEGDVFAASRLEKIFAGR
ncbi:MAG: AAA family ATPase [Solirubrobacterales bacterium]